MTNSKIDNITLHMLTVWHSTTCGLQEWVLAQAPSYQKFNKIDFTQATYETTSRIICLQMDKNLQCA